MSYVLRIDFTRPHKGKLVLDNIETDEVIETRQEAEEMREKIKKDGYKNLSKNEIRNVLIKPRGIAIQN